MYGERREGEKVLALMMMMMMMVMILAEYG